MAWLRSWRERSGRTARGPSARDVRARRLVACIECVLNQNARDAGAARSPAMIREVIRLCGEHDVGLLQMPCPETAFLGLARTRRKGESIRSALDTPDGRGCCAAISRDVADRIERYTDAGYRVLAVLGGNPASPGCAVHEGPDGLLPSSGILMQELEAELRRRSIEIPFRGMRDHDPALLAEDLQWLSPVLSPREGDDGRHR
jgi:predicted secreted protein